MMVTPTARQALDRLMKRIQSSRDDAIGQALADTLTDLAGDAEIGSILYWDGTAWVPTAGTPGEGAVLTIVSGIPTWV